MQRLSVNISLWIAWSSFVVYGSLLPFEYRMLTLDQAIAGFRSMPFLQLGIESRADWVANGVLYVPVGLLTSRMLLAFFGGRGIWIAVLLASIYGVILAASVEFAQLFFPPRVVSQNDLIAECIGSLIGAMVAPWLTPWVARLSGFWSLGGRRLMLGLLEVYLALYLLQSMFPFDFLLDSREWVDKLASQKLGWFMAGASLQRGWLATLFLVIEIFLALPIGLLLAAWWPARRRMVGKALVLGLVVGLAIELGQLTIASGISQGASVITRGLGAALGWWFWHLWADEGGPIAFRRGLRRTSGLLALAYLAVLFSVNGWLSRPWGGLASASVEWAKVRLMPFYYHYYTTEAEAVFSLGSVTLMYLPVAVIGWARRWRPAVTVCVVVALAMVIETSKLFLGGLHPDPSNPLIAMFACSVALWLLGVLERPARTVKSAASSPATGAGQAAAFGHDVRKTGNFSSRFALVVVLMVPVALTLAWFPSQRWLVAAVLLASAAAVWFRPALALAVVPAALPAFDLAPWTGRFFWGEFDLLLLVVLAIGWLRTTPVQLRDATGLARIVPMTLWLFGISLAASAVRGMLPWQWPDMNSFNNYYSGFNALRIVKGAVWALAFMALYRRVAASDSDRFRVLAWGMSAGLVATVALILWERAAYVGLFDFDADYRVTGPFSVMHTGGAYIECYLALATAFLIWLILHTPGFIFRSLGGVVLAATTYAMMVTYSRNGYAAMLIVAVVMGGSMLIRGVDAPSKRSGLLGLVLVTLMVVAAIPVLRGTFAQQRLEQIEADFATRIDHWKDALSTRDENLPTAIIGMGLGRFPATHYWRSAEPVKAASFGLAVGKEGTYLRLGTGSQVYIEQVVDVRPGQHYRLSLRLRSAAPAMLGIALCEKWMLTSASCDLQRIVADGVSKQWQTVNATFSTEKWTARSWPQARLVKFSLFSSAGPGVIEVADVQLTAEDGTQILHNGNFSQGLDRWFFSADVDPPWHIHSLPVTVLFEQGWFGLLALAAAWAAAISLAVVRTLRADPIAPPILAALLAFTASGVLNTLIDAPRFLLLILFLAWLCSHSGRRPSRLSRLSGPDPA